MKVFFLESFITYGMKKLKTSRTCLIGYSGFILHEQFLIACGQTHTHRDTYQFPRQKQFQETTTAFDWHMCGLKMSHYG